MGFQPGGLVSEQGIGNGMGLVETVTGKFFHQVKNGGCHGFADFIALSAFHENVPLLGHLFALFLTHGAPQQVRRPQGVAAEEPGYLHDLFLVQDHAIGRFQHRFQCRVNVAYLRLALFPVDKIINHSRIQGAGPE